MCSCRRCAASIEGYPLDGRRPGQFALVLPIVRPDDGAAAGDARERRLDDRRRLLVRRRRGPSRRPLPARDACRVRRPARLPRAVDLRHLARRRSFCHRRKRRRTAMEIRDRLSDLPRSGRSGRSAVRLVRRADAALRRRQDGLPAVGSRRASRNLPPPPSRTSTASIASARFTSSTLPTARPSAASLPAACSTALVNDQTDRLFLISESGLVQCLHEIGANKPTHYVERPAAETKPAEPAADEYHGDGQPAAKPAPQPPAAQPVASPPQAADPLAMPAAEDKGGTPFGAPPADGSCASGRTKPTSAPAKTTRSNSAGPQEGMRARRNKKRRAQKEGPARCGIPRRPSQAGDLRTNSPASAAYG